MAATLIRKLSIKSVVGKLDKAALKELGKAQDLMTIVGIASGVKTGESTYGTWFALIGRFRAVNMITGETFEAGKAFLPEAITEQMVSFLQKEGNDAIEFAVVVSAKSTDTEVGYEYSVRPLIETQGNDPLAHLMSALPKETVALVESAKNAPPKAPAVAAPKTNAKIEAPKASGKK